MSAIHKGTLIGGKYRLEVSLAQGGMGSVWAARHLALDTLFAIKFIHHDSGPESEARRRFEREAKAAARLQSANVVQIHDYGLEGETPYIVMELLEGEDLSTRLFREGRLPLAETCTIVTQVARALRRAADAGVVHRDLKPSNVFLVASDDDPVIKVLDFGVAKAPLLGVDAETTRAGAVIGSPRYMSPEQARGSRGVDHRSDLWSLAVIAFRALTGRVPFQAEDLGEVILEICTKRAPAPSSIEPSLGPEIDAFFAKALDRNPARRFQSAPELAAAFALAAGQAPPASLARPASVALSPPVVASRPAPRDEPVGTATTPDGPARSAASRRVSSPTGSTAKRAVEVEITRPSFQPSPSPALPPAPPLPRAPVAAEVELEAPSEETPPPAPPQPSPEPPRVTPVIGAVEAPGEAGGRATLVPREPNPSAGTLASYHGPVSPPAPAAPTAGPLSLRPFVAIAGFACLLGGSGLCMAVVGHRAALAGQGAPVFAPRVAETYAVASPPAPPATATASACAPRDPALEAPVPRAAPKPARAPRAPGAAAGVVHASPDDDRHPVLGI